MIKMLLWIIVTAWVIDCFPEIAVGAAVLVVLFFDGVIITAWSSNRRGARKQEEERIQASEKPRECETAENKWAEEWAQEAETRRKRWSEAAAAKAQEVEKVKRERNDRIKKYNRLAKEAAAEGEVEDAVCWRHLAVEELKKLSDQFNT